MYEPSHSFELSTGEDWRHDASEELPLLPLEVRGHVHRDLVDGVGQVEVDRAPVREVIEVLHHDSFGDFQIVHWKKGKNKTTLNSTTSSVRKWLKFLFYLVN